MVMVPKTWAVFTDAVDEASAHAARQVIEACLERVPRACPQRHLVETKLDEPAFYAQIAEIIDREVTNAVSERFSFIEAPGE